MAIVLAQLASLLALGGVFGPYLLAVFLVLFASGANFARLLWIGSTSRRG